jgi:hypothetical protein
MEGTKLRGGALRGVTTIVRKSYPGGRCYLLGQLIQDTASRYYYRRQLGAKLAFVVCKSPSIHIMPCPACPDWVASQRLSSPKTGAGIGGRPRMKRGAAKLVSLSNNRQGNGATLVYTKPDPTLSEIGTRLELTRRALILTRFQMARLLGTDMPTWGTYEAGLERIPVDQAVKLTAYGIPLEWIYQGRMTKLHPHVRAMILELQTSSRG